MASRPAQSTLRAPGARRAIALAVVALAAAASSGCLRGPGGGGSGEPPARVTIEEAGLLVDGKPFLVKGVVYSPVPPGVDPLGKDESWTWIEHPEIYERDFALMKRMGANAIRVVDASLDVASMDRMLDSAHEHGIRVVLGLRGPAGLDAGDAPVRERALAETRDLVRAYRSHPAILMWLFGNEVNYRYQGEDVRDWYSLLGEMAKLARDLDENHPVATANNALNGLDDLLELAPAVNVYGTNQYAPDSTDFVGSLVPTFASRAPGMPFLVTEFGADAWGSDVGREDEETQARILRENWRALSSLAPPTGPVVGGFVFEWSDEWWKGGDADAPDPEASWQPPNPGSLLLDRTFSEEFFGVMRTTRDGLEPRAAFAALQGEWASFLAPEPPSVVKVFSGTEGDRIRVTADVYTYGDVPVDVSLEYRVRAGSWRSTEMRALDADTFLAEFGPLDGVVILFYRIRAVDEAGRVTTTPDQSARAIPEASPALAAAVACAAAVFLAARRRA